MRIAQIAALITPDGAFGGPVRVAANQARTLAARGHDLELFAATSGFDTVPSEYDGVPLRAYSSRQLVPGTGFLGRWSSGLQKTLRSELSTFDVVHIHMGRDMVTMAGGMAARSAGTPYVLQTHGMVGPTSHPLGKPLDALLTRRLLAGAAARLYLTPRELGELHIVSRRKLDFQNVPNGVPEPTVTRKESLPPDVLFLARLHERKRPLMFVEAARRLRASGVDATFSLVGPDEGQGQAVADEIRRIGDSSIRWEGAVAPEHTQERLARSTVYALPSVDEPFPMSVLEALSLGLPTVVTDTCGLAPAIARHGAGVVIDDTVDALERALRELVGDDRRRYHTGKNALALVRDEFSMSAVAARLEHIYAEAIRS